MNTELINIDDKLFDLIEGLHDDSIIDQVTLLPGEDGDTKEKRSVRAEIAFLKRQRLNLLASVVTLDTSEEIVSSVEMNIADAAKEHYETMSHLYKTLEDVKTKIVDMTVQEGKGSEAHA